MQPIREGNWSGVDQNLNELYHEIRQLRGQVRQLQAYSGNLAAAVGQIPIVPASGVPVSPRASTSPGTGISWTDMWGLSTPKVKNLVVRNNGTNPTYQLDVTADWAILTSAYDKPSRVKTVSCTVSLGTTGVNALDTGSRATSTWYYLWLIGSGTSTGAGLFSTSSTAPTMPTGYDYKQLIGAFRTDATGSGNFHELSQIGNFVSYHETHQVATATGTAAWTDQSCASFLPPISRRGFFALHALEGGTGAQWIGLRPKGSTATYGSVSIYMDTSARATCEGFCDTDASQVIQLSITNSSTWYIWCRGYFVNI